MHVPAYFGRPHKPPQRGYMTAKYNSRYKGRIFQYSVRINSISLLLQQQSTSLLPKSNRIYTTMSHFIAKRLHWAPLFPAKQSPCLKFPSRGLSASANIYGRGGLATIQSTQLSGNAKLNTPWTLRNGDLLVCYSTTTRLNTNKRFGIDESSPLFARSC